MSETISTASCTFCELVGGRGDLSVVASNDLVLAFMDACPVAPGHVLVVPRRHVSSLDGLTPDEGAALWATTQVLASRVRAKLAPAVNLHLAEGVEAEQDVSHVHMHVIPRHGEDVVTIELPGRRASREELDRAAASLADD